MSSLKDVGERGLIRNIMDRIRRSEPLNAGDDAAVLDVSGKIVVSTDIVTFARHRPEGMTYEEFGWMAAAVNFSDIASMGGRPIGLLASLFLPPDLDESSLYEMMSGLDQCAEHCGTYVIGGDTKTGEGGICCTAIGDMDGREPMTRRGANVGDVVAVTGTLGSPAAGFYALKNGIDENDAIMSLKVPIPKVNDGIILSEAGATSCMDISDGLSTTVIEICSKSGVGMDILWASLPKGNGVERLSSIVSEEHMMLDFGGEYELLFTMDKENIAKLYDRMEFTIIGTVNDGDGAYILKDGKRIKVQNGGYEHFKDRS